MFEKFNKEVSKR